MFDIKPLAFDTQCLVLNPKSIIIYSQLGVLVVEVRVKPVRRQRAVQGVRAVEDLRQHRVV